MGTGDLKLAMALKVRDEEDVLEQNLRYHRAQGVDFFIVTDNASTDRTPEILERWVEAGLATVIHEPGDDLAANGHKWVTRMAREAATEHGADWVVHGDADEFWWPLEGSLKEALAAIPPEYGTVVAPRTEFIARPDGPGEFYDRLTIRSARSLLRPKVAHRAYPDVFVLHEGQHDVTVGTDLDDAWRRARPPGRPVLRAAREERRDTDDRLTWAPTFPLVIFHFPLRSLAQYRLRVEVLLANPSFAGEEIRERMRSARAEDDLEGFYAQLIKEDTAVDAGLESGELVRDDRLSRYMQRVGSPPIEQTGPVAPEANGRLDAERAQVEVDAMYVLARSSRMLMIRQDLAALERRARRRERRRERRMNRLDRRFRRWLGARLGRGAAPADAEDAGAPDDSAQR
jgi:Glycosyl transferase family 2